MTKIRICPMKRHSLSSRRLPDRLVEVLARVSDSDQLLTQCHGSKLIVRVKADAIFTNCPRYIHKMQIVEQSVYAPCEGHVPPVPGWEKQRVFSEVLPPGDSAAN